MNKKYQRAYVAFLCLVSIFLSLDGRAFALECGSKITVADIPSQLAVAKFQTLSGCSNVAQRLREDYSGEFPHDFPDEQKPELLQQRCELVKELLETSVKSCDDAKRVINQFEVSHVLSKTMGPQIVAQLAKPSFFENFLNAYKTPSVAPVGDPAAYRGYPAPLDSPPFPNAVWPYGGSPTIGQPNPVSGTPLMQGLSGTSLGDTMEHYRVAVYGWVNPSINVSTSQSGGYDNAPLAYEQRSGKVELEQAALFIERVPDTVQNDHFDFGYRVTGLYGLDYRFTMSKGLFSNQLLKQDNEYGYDIPMAYIDLYFPVKDGLDVRVGRTISVPDIEAQLATSNYMAVHSLLYSYDDYTQTGVFATLKLNKNWLIQAGITAGSDVMPWAKPDARPTGLFCVNYTNMGGKQNFYLCDNSINSGAYAYNDQNQYNFTHYFKISDSLHSATEFIYEQEKNVPNLNASTPTETGANGAYFPTGQATGTARERGVVNFLEKQVSGNGYISLRNGFFADPYGQRTGTPTKYSEHALGVVRYFANKKMQCRPEVGFMRSYERPAFDNGTKKNQIYSAADCIFSF